MGDRLATIDMGRKLPGLCPFGGAGSPCNNVACVEAYLRTKWHLDPSSRLAITDMGRFFLEGGCSPWGVELSLHLTQCCPGRGLPSYQVASWSIHRLATTNMDRKLGDCVQFVWGGGAGSPSSTMWPGPWPTSIPSGILIHAVVWPQ